MKALVVLAGLAACVHSSPPPAAPSPTVRADVGRAEDAEMKRRHDVARAEYERAIADAHDPHSQAFARREFAETLTTWGELAEAATQLDAAVAAEPNDAPSWHDLGLVRHKLGNDLAAVTALSRAKELAPRDPRPRIALAALYLCQNNIANATAEYRGLLELELPDRLREKVRYMLDQLPKQAAPLHCS
jgi:Flp pilus assembly protein TadD